MSLIAELANKDPVFVNSRVQQELNRLSPTDRNTFWAYYNASYSHIKDVHVKQDMLVRLLDSFLRGSIQPHRSCQSNHYTPYNTTPTAVPIQPQPTPVSSGGKMVGDYILKKTIGQGTFGKVKLAEHIHSGQQVAIKVIEKSNVKTHKQRNSVQREVRLMKLLHHPHIVEVLDIIENADQIFIIMEYASGGELFDYIVSHGMVKEKEARAFFRQILSAVDYCHQNSIIHRDLKPENLLLDSNKNIKIIDFGFGNTFHRERTLDTYCGSPFYAAPEMIRGVRYVGPEVDVWSLGVILFALLSGRLPFDAASMTELYDRISKGTYTTPAHFSSEASELIQRMLTVDPKKRATLEEVIRHKWVRHGYEEPINNYLQARPRYVPNPHPESLRELVSYGIAESEIKRLLNVSIGLHPITSLYHLVEEARGRREAHMLQLHALHHQLILQQQRTLISLEDPYTHHSQVYLTYGHGHSNTSMSTHSAPTTPTPPTTQDSATTLAEEDVYVHGCEGKTNVTNAAGINSTHTYTPAVMTSTPTHINNNDINSISSNTANRNMGNGNGSGVSGGSATNINISKARERVSRVRFRGGNNAEERPGSAPLERRDSREKNIYSSQTKPSTSISSASTGVRVVKGFFNVSTTSSKSEPEIIAEIERVLNANDISFVRQPNSFICEETDSGSSGNKFEIEICRVQNLGLYGLNLKRVRGTVWGHKKLCNKLVSEMRL